MFKYIKNYIKYDYTINKLFKTNYYKTFYYMWIAKPTNNSEEYITEHVDPDDYEDKYTNAVHLIDKTYEYGTTVQIIYFRGLPREYATIIHEGKIYKCYEQLFNNYGERKLYAKISE